MSLWLVNFIGHEIISILPPFALIAVGFLAEKHYTGRMAIFANSIALITFFHTIENLPFLLSLYINILTIAGILSIISYAFKFKLPTEFYKLAGIFSSVLSGVILLWGLTL